MHKGSDPVPRTCPAITRHMRAASALRWGSALCDVGTRGPWLARSSIIPSFVRSRGCAKLGVLDKGVPCLELQFRPRTGRCAKSRRDPQRIAPGPRTMAPRPTPGPKTWSIFRILALGACPNPSDQTPCRPWTTPTIDVVLKSAHVRPGPRAAHMPLTCCAGGVRRKAGDARAGGSPTGGARAQMVTKGPASLVCGEEFALAATVCVAVSAPLVQLGTPWAPQSFPEAQEARFLGCGDPQMSPLVSCRHLGRGQKGSRGFICPIGRCPRIDRHYLDVGSTSIAFGDFGHTFAAGCGRVWGELDQIFPTPNLLSGTWKLPESVLRAFKLFVSTHDFQVAASGRLRELELCRTHSLETYLETSSLELETYRRPQTANDGEHVGRRSGNALET